jgi:hypothetical protein
MFSSVAFDVAVTKNEANQITLSSIVSFAILLFIYSSWGSRLRARYLRYSFSRGWSDFCHIYSSMAISLPLVSTIASKGIAWGTLANRLGKSAEVDDFIQSAY